MRNQLEAAFGNCKYPHNCNCTIKSSFETTKQKEFFVIDEEGEVPVRIVSQKGKSHLTVKNESSKEICLVKTDDCLFTDDTKKCDCILFDDKQLVLAELKDSRVANMGPKRKKAIAQFKATINLLKLGGIDRNNYKTIALICFKSVYKIPNARDKSQRADFLDDKVSLQEGNVFSFL